MAKAATLRKKDLPEHDELLARVLAIYGRATKDDALAGIAWYDEAQELAKDIAAGTPFTVEQIAGVISAVSPRMPWGRNKTVAREIVKRFSRNGGYGADYSGLGIGANVALAVDILAGVNPESVLKAKRLAFYRNIAGDPNAVTVDVWATKAVIGNHVDAPGSCYDDIAAAYSAAAQVVGIAPRVMQATVWIAYRRSVLSEKHLNWLERDTGKVYL